jgi:hypothetical protein
MVVVLGVTPVVLNRGACISAGQVLGVGMSQKAAWLAVEYCRPQRVSSYSAQSSHGWHAFSGELLLKACSVPLTVL